MFNFENNAVVGVIVCEVSLLIQLSLTTRQTHWCFRNVIVSQWWFYHQEGDMYIPLFVYKCKLDKLIGKNNINSISFWLMAVQRLMASILNKWINIHTLYFNILHNGRWSLEWFCVKIFVRFYSSRLVLIALWYGNSNVWMLIMLTARNRNGDKICPYTFL